jgi:hypothetical protein
LCGREHGYALRRSHARYERLNTEIRKDKGIKIADKDNRIVKEIVITD